MKKLIVFTLVLTVCFTLLAGCAKSAGTPSDEMKIPYSCDLSPDDGADGVERQGDHPDSPYFKAPDFYNMKSTDTLTILTNFKTQQQTSEWSCGVSSVLMMLEWYGKRGDYSEETLAQFRSNGLTPAPPPCPAWWRCLRAWVDSTCSPHWTAGIRWRKCSPSTSFSRP